MTSMVEMPQIRTQLTTLHKVRAHANIEGNEKADELAKLGRVKDHREAKHPYEHTHATPFYFQKDDWPSMAATPDKGPICFLDKYLKRLNLSNNLELIENQISNVKKWTSDANIDLELSTNFWKNPPSRIHKKPASSNSALDNTWAMSTNKHSLNMHASLPSLAQSVTPPTLTHGPMYFSIVKTNTFMD